MTSCFSSIHPSLPPHHLLHLLPLFISRPLYHSVWFYSCFSFALLWFCVFISSHLFLIFLIRLVWPFLYVSSPFPPAFCLFSPSVLRFFPWQRLSNGENDQIRAKERKKKSNKPERELKSGCGLWAMEAKRGAALEASDEVVVVVSWMAWRSQSDIGNMHIRDTNAYTLACT